MSKVKNISGRDRFVPWLNRLVLAGQVVEVPESDADAYTQQTATWQAVDDNPVTAAKSKATSKKAKE